MERLMMNVVMLSTVIGLSLILMGVASGRTARAAKDPGRGYQKLEKAILDGKSISMTLDLAACHVHGTDKPGPNVRGSMRSEGYMIEADQTIAFATTHFTVKSDNTPIDEFLSFRVQPSGVVIARSRFLNASTYAVVHDATYDCAIGNGTTFHW
jgi:hypothetical protein